MSTHVHGDMVSRKYGECSVVNATIHHVHELQDNLRAPDTMECQLLGSSPKKAMMLALTTDLSTYAAIDGEGKAFAMFGSGPLKDDLGYIWMLGTDDVLAHKRQFIRASRDWVNFLSKPYSFTTNVVLKDNKVAVRWLKFCGAKFLREVKLSGHDFYEFIITPN